MTAVDTDLLFAWLNRDHAWHAAAAAWMSSQATNFKDFDGFGLVRVWNPLEKA